MANVIIKLRVMPDSPAANLDSIEQETSKLIKADNGYLHKVEREPIAFGLIALDFIFMIPEAHGSTEKLEERIKKVKQVQSADVIDVRRAFG